MPVAPLTSGSGVYQPAKNSCSARVIGHNGPSMCKPQIIARCGGICLSENGRRKPRRYGRGSNPSEQLT
jgi:hypothetical protein